MKKTKDNGAKSMGLIMLAVQSASTMHFGLGFKSIFFKLESIMKKAITFIAAFIAISSVAYAACPPSAPYRCVPTFGGKQICGCGY